MQPGAFVARKRFESIPCGVEQTLEQLGDWWTLLIVRDAFLGLSRFSEFQKSLGIAKNILSDRLQKLVEHGVFEKTRLPESGRRYAYPLMKKGRELWLILTAMRLWSDKWVFGPDAVPIVARERETGREVTALVAVDRNGDPIEPRRLEWATGPGLRRERG